MDCDSADESRDGSQRTATARNLGCRESRRGRQQSVRACRLFDRADHPSDAGSRILMRRNDLGGLSSSDPTIIFDGVSGRMLSATAEEPVARPAARLRIDRDQRGPRSSLHAVENSSPIEVRHGRQRTQGR